MIKKATINECKLILELSLLLWPDNTLGDLEKEISENLVSDNTAFFLAYDSTHPIGFAQCQLRSDYVEGTNSSPVGYLEGIFVKDNYRNKGIARQLLLYSEEWAKERGCKEFASDCELLNADSFHFHMKTGFKEANRIICFTKKL